MSSTQMIINQPWNDVSVYGGDKKEKFSEQVKEVATRELRENECIREQCLEQFKDWIQKNKDIENCLIDDNFLLRFLRARKFSLHMAQQLLLKYLNFRKRFMYIFNNMDYLDPQINELLNNGYIFVSPFKDKNGRRIVITTPRFFDPSKYNSTDMARAHLITYETLLENEENQILGLIHIGDVADGSPSLISMWSITEFIILIRWGLQSLPMRHKQIHVIHLPNIYKYVYDFAGSLGTQKLRDRAKIHDNFKQLHTYLDPSLLPAEYGGIMPMSEMIELWKKELANRRNRLLSFNKMNLLSDQGIIRRRTKISEDYGINGSFRKLEVD